MSIRVISQEHYQIICEMFSCAESSIKIMSPFISADMAQLLTGNMEKNPALNVEIITRFYREDFVKGVSDIIAIEKLRNAGAKVYALLGLHTKLYLCDTDSALLGSANFTSGGFKSNHELSMYVKDEDEVNPQLVAYFDDFVEAIVQSGDYLLTSEKIANEKHEVESLAENVKIKNTERGINARFGASIPKLPQTSNAEETENSVFEIQNPADNSKNFFVVKYEKATQETKELFSLLRTYIKSLGDNIVEKQRKKDIDFSAPPHWIASVHISRQWLRVHIGVEAASLTLAELEDGFIQTYGERDPGNISVKINNRFDLEKAKPLIKRAYNRN